MPGAAVAWAGVAGFAGAVLLTLALALPSLLGRAEEVPRLAGSMFTVSYGLAMGLALAAGWVADVSGVAAAAFVPFGVAAVLVVGMGAGLRVGR